MRLLMARSVNRHELLTADRWQRVEVPEARTHREAAICLANEPGFFPPWGGRTWLHLALDVEANMHPTGVPKKVFAYDVEATPEPVVR